MPRDFFDPPFDETNILNISASTLRKAEALILGCEASTEEANSRLIVLSAWLANDPAVTGYIGRCVANTHAPIRERSNFFQILRVAGLAIRPLDGPRDLPIEVTSGSTGALAP